MASLESLNDDCLREILQYCEPNDHIAFVVAFEQFKPIFRDIWKMFWRKVRFSNSNTVRLSNIDKGDRIEINSQRFKIVIDLMQPFVEKIEIIRGNKEIWHIINESQFPKATELSLYNTSAALIVKSCFPNLRSLVLHGDSVVEYNPEWNGLENVHIRNSNMSTSEIMEFISQLKLKKLTINRFPKPFYEEYRNYEYFSELEEISGCISTMRKFANAFNVMHKLRKVSVRYRSIDKDTDISIFSKILGTRAVEFFINCFYLKDLTPTDGIKYLEKQLEELPNLKRLTLECRDIEAIPMFSRSCYLHLLKAIILTDMRVDAEILTNILISVPELELLELSCRLNSCIRPIHLDVASIAQKRSKPVIINVVPKYYNKVAILLSAPTDLITITKNDTEFPDCFVKFIYILEKQ